MISKLETYIVTPIGKPASLEDIKQCVEIAKSNNCIVSLTWTVKWSGTYTRHITKDDDPQKFYEEKLPKFYGL